MSDQISLEDRTNALLWKFTQLAKPWQNHGHIPTISENISYLQDVAKKYDIKLNENQIKKLKQFLGIKFSIKKSALDTVSLYTQHSLEEGVESDSFNLSSSPYLPKEIFKDIVEIIEFNKSIMKDPAIRAKYLSKNQNLKIGLTQFQKDYEKKIGNLLNEYFFETNETQIASTSRNYKSIQEESNLAKKLGVDDSIENQIEKDEFGFISALVQKANHGHKDMYRALEESKEEYLEQIEIQNEDCVKLGKERLLYKIVKEHLS